MYRKTQYNRRKARYQTRDSQENSKPDLVGLQEPQPVEGFGDRLTADRLAQLVEHRTAVREVAGTNLDRTNTQGL